jgi:iron complex outermembrane receptor protein
MSSVKSISFVPLLAAVALFFGSSAAAQDTQGARPANLPGLALEEIIVTARKREESIQESPISITAFSEADMAMRGMSDISDLGAYTPNMSFAAGDALFGNSSSAFVFIRGVGQTDSALFADAGVGIFLDGVFLARSQGTVLELLDLARVEVLRGPQGTLFGRNTIGGAVSLVTKKPDADFHGDAELTIGRYDRQDAKLRVNVPVSDNFFLGLAASSNNRDGYTDSAFDGTEYGDIDRDQFRGVARWIASDAVEVILTGDYHRKRENGPLQKAIRIEPAAIQPLYNEAAREGGGYEFAADPWALPGSSLYENFTSISNPADDVDTWGVSATVDWTVGPVLVTSITSYREMENLTELDADGTPGRWLDPGQEIEQDQFSQELRFSGVGANDRLTWLFGAYYFEEEGLSITRVDLFADLFQNLEAAPFMEVDGFLPPGSCPPPPDVVVPCAGGAGNPFNLFWVDTVGAGDDPALSHNNTSNDNYAFFLHTTYDFTHKIAATVGVRYTHEEKSLIQFDTDIVTGEILPSSLDRDEEGTWESWTPRFGLDFRVSDEVLIYASASKGFKSGGFNGRSQNRPRFDVYDPEELWSYEIGFKSEWFDNRFRLNGAVFFNEYDGIQFTASDVDDEGNAVFQLTNAGDAEISGVELEFIARLGERLQLDGGVGYLDTEYTKVLPTPGSQITLDNAFPRAPEWTMNFGAEYMQPLGGAGSLITRLDFLSVSRVEQDIFNTPAISQAGYSKVNARFVYQPVSRRWEVAAFVNNVTDEETIAAGFTVAALGYDLITPARKREWGASFRLFF